jgi:integrase
MAIGTITIRSVDSLRAGETLWDSTVRGFGVRRQKRDAVYVLKYRFQRRQRFFTIGRHGSPWTPDTARNEARRLLGMIASRERPRDPAEERDCARAELTLAEFAERYVADYATAHKKPRTVEEDRRNLRLHVLPGLGHLRLSEIRRADVARFHIALRDQPVNANRCLALISHMMTIAERWELRAANANPSRGIVRYREVARERLLSADEIGRLGDVLERVSRGYTDADLGQIPAADRPRRGYVEDWRAPAMIRLLLFTGARLGEIRTLRWDWIDSNRGVARLPDSKTGAKNIPLTSAALAVLTQIPPCPDSPLVLPGDRPGGYYIGIQRSWNRIRSLAGLPDVRLHDLRHAYASIAVLGGHSLFMVGKMLGHRHASTTQRYAHLAADPVRAAADKTADQISALLRGGQAEIVPFRSSK